MENLIVALNIFIKYGNLKYPTWCEHDTLHVCIEPEKVSNKDKVELEKLGFYAGDDDFASFKYGSA